VEAAVEAMVRFGSRFEPNPANSRTYERSSSLSVELYNALKPIFRKYSQ
jgi:hypothetical protein